MSAPKLPKWQTDLFAAVYTLATDIAPRADVAAVLKLMSAVHPNLPQLAAAEARILIHAGDLNGARSVLERTERAHPSNAVIKAMLSFCLYVQQDGLWEAYAEEALALPHDAAARGIIQAVEASSNKKIRVLSQDTSAHLSMLPPMAMVC
ncbi:MULTISPECIES: HrpB1 family type III secretion system apparatus protein [unclassified Rhizobacter]|uniref:HrpB1 family type III secretion system apparatus protein n=1 Tax=unclassified Rhizobacter TaxID=2640088 RepID=UPI000A5F667F|nr:MULTISPECIES: HrpB1 family type III secretion system apparatus protein [unclassified Rhizobacter]